MWSELTLMDESPEEEKTQGSTLCMSATLCKALMDDHSTRN